MILQLLVWFSLFTRRLEATESSVKFSAGRRAEDVRNPMVETDKCGRKGLKSNVCDPDNVILFGEASQLDEQIIHLYNDTQCPCSTQVCRRLPGGYHVAVAIVRNMLLEPSIRLQASMGNDDMQIKMVDVLLNEAKLFSYSLVRSWSLGRCNESVLIFYSRDDNVIYTVTSAKAREKLPDALVGEITLKSRIFFGPDKYTNWEGLQRIISDYREVFQGVYKRERTSDESQVQRDQLRDAGSNNALLLAVLLLCLLAATCIA